MSKIVARNFIGLGLDLKEFDIDNSRPDGRYLDEVLTSGLYSCKSGEEKLYFGIGPFFPWQNIDDAPKNEYMAKRMIALRLLKYLNEERSRLKEDSDEYESDLEELPTADQLIAKIHYIEDSWLELW